MSKTTEYLEAFKPVATAWFTKAAFVREYHEFFREFFQRDKLETAEWPDIQKIGAHLHCFQSMALAKANALGKPNHPLEHYRKSFIFLAHGPGEPSERIRQFSSNPEYRLDYFGKSAVSELVGYLFPDQFMFVNARDLFAAQFLDIKIEKSAGGDLVAGLEAFSKATRPVAKEYEEIVGKQTDLPLNLELDQFFSWLYETYANADGTDKPVMPPVSSRRYWTLSPGEGGNQWENFYEDGIAAIGWYGTGDLRKFKNKDEILQKIQELQPGESSPTNDAYACWQFVHDLKPGDIVFAKKGRTKLLGYGEVKGDYKFDSARPHYRHIRNVKWSDKGEWDLPDDHKMALKTLTDITTYSDFVAILATTVGLQLSPSPPADVVVNSTHYWWLNANPKIWDFRNLPLGAVESYTSRNEAGNKRQKYKHFEAVRPGDLLLGYVTNPDKEIVAICEITKPLHDTVDGEVIEFRKIEEIRVPVTLAELQSVDALSECEPLIHKQGSLFAVTADEYDVIRAMIDERNLVLPPSQTTVYTKEDALKGLFMTELQLDKILSRLKRKKTVILQGPPGVGKTFVARRLAYLQMGEQDPQRVKMVQFHPSYGYEDFVQGYRPKGTGLGRHDGVFHQFARLARNDPQRDWFFVIDEINRGNLAKIFGELLMLIEADKRGPEHAIPLTYSEEADETFYLPANLYIIGTMNTADRSLAMVDYALRRRFAFVTLDPEFASPAFGAWLTNCGASNELLNRIRQRIDVLNAAIDKDRDLGAGFRIGHSFFAPATGPLDEAWYREVIDSEIQPLLEEYFDSHETVDQLVKDLLA